MNLKSLRSASRLLFICSCLMISGLWAINADVRAQPQGSETPLSEQAPEVIASVRVKTISNTLITRRITFSGETQADRNAELRAETRGKVVTLNVAEGDRVSEGTSLLQLDERDLERQLDAARALVKQRELEYRGSQSLQGKGLVANTRLAESEAALKQAQASLAKLKEDLKATVIRAPFDGLLERLDTELGEFVQEGQAVAQLISMSPVIASGWISEKDRHIVKKGQGARVTMSDGDSYDAEVSFVASEASKPSRMYRVETRLKEASVDNMPLAAPTQLTITTGNVMAAKISPALLSLDNDGRFGLKIVDDRQRVRFATITIVEASSDGVWVQGLEDNTYVITVGQGFVNAGDLVSVALERSTPDNNVTSQSTSTP